MICYTCNADLIESEVCITDGDKCLCEECARKESNRIFDNLMSIYEAEDDVLRMAFAKFGIDDFAYCVDEELRK